MHDRLRRRIEELDAEYRAGERMLADLDAQRADLQQTLLRIDGARQVLDELVSDEPEGTDDAATG